MTPDELSAREAIRQLQAAYHLAGDRGRVEDMVATFAEDGVFEWPSGTYRGRDDIRAGLLGLGDRRAAEKPATRPAFVRHHLTTSLVEFVSDTEARGWSYFLVMSPVGVDHCGRYIDRYVAEHGRWLIKSRRIVVEWVADDSVVGAGLTDDRKVAG